MTLAPPQNFSTGSLHSGYAGTMAPSQIPPIPEDVAGDDTMMSLSSALTTDNDPDLRATYGTPDSDLPLSQVLNSDITMICVDCGQYIDVASLRDHRNYHQALKLMEYTTERPPPDTKDLIVRRQHILSRYSAFTDVDNPLDPLLVQRINDAFEYLRAEVENTFDSCRKLRESRDYEQRGFSLGCSAECVCAVGVCSDGNSRWRTSMQDTRVYQDCFGSDPGKAFFAIFDGHHGPYSAEVAAEHLHHALLNQMSRFDRRTKCDCTYNLAEYEQSLTEPHEVHSRVTSKYTERGELYQESISVIHKLISDCEQKLLELLASGEEVRTASREKKQKRVSKDPFSLKMANAFTKAYNYTDVLLSWGKDEESRVRWSGCSALTCVIQDSQSKSTSDAEQSADKHDADDQSAVQGAKQTADTADEHLLTKVLNEDNGEPHIEQLGVIHLANAGNTRAILVRDNVAYRISRDHTPQNAKEKKRIIKAGGVVSANEKEMLVNGVLATTRGLGNHGDPPLKKCVITEPYTTSVQIDNYAQCVIIASHGVWEVFTDQEAASLIVQLLPPNHLQAPSHVSASISKLLNRSLASGMSRSALSTSRLSDLESRADDISTYNPDGLNLFKNRKSATKRASRPNTSKSILSTGSRVSHASQVSFASDVAARKSKSASTVSTQLIEEDLQSKSEELASNEKSDASKLTAESIINDDDSGEDGDIDTELGSAGESVDGSIAQSEYSEISIERTQEGIYKQFAQLLSERLTEAALMAGARDNVTVMVLLLPGCGLNVTGPPVM